MLDAKVDISIDLEREIMHDLEEWWDHELNDDQRFIIKAGIYSALRAARLADPTILHYSVGSHHGFVKVSGEDAFWESYKRETLLDFHKFAPRDSD